MWDVQQAHCICIVSCIAYGGTAKHHKVLLTVNKSPCGSMYAYLYRRWYHVLQIRHGNKVRQSSLRREW